MADLITLNEYKAYKKINNPEKDELIQVIISSVSEMIKAYCGRTFIDYYENEKTEAFNIREGMTALVLTETPIIGPVVVESEDVDISADISIDPDLGIIEYTDDAFAAGLGTVVVTYTGGYEETPADIKLAAFELVDYYLQGEHTQIKSFPGGGTVEYFQTENSWPFHIKTILDMYRDV